MVIWGKEKQLVVEAQHTRSGDKTTVYMPITPYVIGVAIAAWILLGLVGGFAILALLQVLKAWGI